MEKVSCIYWYLSQGNLIGAIRFPCLSQEKKTTILSYIITNFDRPLMHPLASNWCDLDLYNQYCILNLGSYRRCHSTYRHLHLVLNFHQILSWCIWHKSIHDHTYWHLIAKFHPVDGSIFSWSNWGNRPHIIAICGSVSRINCHCYQYTCHDDCKHVRSM